MKTSVWRTLEAYFKGSGGRTSHRIWPREGYWSSVAGVGGRGLYPLTCYSGDASPRVCVSVACPSVDVPIGVQFFKG